MSGRISKLIGRGPSKASERDRHIAEFIDAAKSLKDESRVLNAMLKAGKVKVTDRDPHGVTALHWVARKGSVKGCEVLLRQPGVDINVIDGHRQATPLWWAISGLPFGGDCCAVMEYLLANGADPTICDHQGRTPLRYLIQEIEPGLVDAFRVLVGPHTDLPDQEGLTPLMMAVIDCRPIAVQSLLSCRASVQTADNRGATPLHHAVIAGNTKCIYLLLKNGARIDTKNCLGKTPYDDALVKGESMFTAIHTAAQESAILPLLALHDHEAQAAFYIMDQMINKQTGTMNEPGLAKVLRRLILKLAIETNSAPEYLLFEDSLTDFFSPLIPGGFSIVQGAYHTSGKVALKTLTVSGNALGGIQNQTSFVREVLIWRHLKHPNILSLIGIQRDPMLPERFMMISPWMVNKSARLYINSHGWNEKLYSNWLIRVVQGLHYLHQEEVVHGDLRADNVLVDSQLQIKLADFGLAVFATSTTATLGETHPGHPRWLSPEFLEGKLSKPDYPCDVFSFGRLCVEFYTGDIPFAEQYSADNEDTRKVIKNAVRNYNIEPSKPSKMGNELWSLVKQCWILEPNKRLHTNAINSKLLEILS